MLIDDATFATLTSLPTWWLSAIATFKKQLQALIPTALVVVERLGRKHVLRITTR